MAGLEQPGQAGAGLEALVEQAFVERFQFMGQVADLADLGHARATLEGVQVALQGGQRGRRLRGLAPLRQGLAGAVEDVHGLFEEDRHHFLVQRLHGAGRANVFRLDRRGLLRLCGRRRRRPLQVLGQVFRRGGAVEQQLFVLQREIVGGELVEVDEIALAVGLRLHRRGCLIGLHGGRLEQALQGLDLLRAGADLQRRGHLVHHADQRLVGVFGGAEEGVAHRQPALLHRAVDGQQRLAEFGHLRQLGLLRALGQCRQLLVQGAQLLAFVGVFAPAAEQVLGVQQYVHALGEEQAEHLRIAATLAAFAATLGLRGLQALLLDLGDALQQLVAAVDVRQRTAGVQLLQTHPEQALGLAQQLGLAQVDLQQVGLELLHQPLQRRGDFRDRQDAGHVRAALEGVQGALQVVGDRLGQLAVAVGEEAAEGFQMGFGLVAEDFQQLRVETFVQGRGFDRRLQRHFFDRRCFPAFRRRHRFALGQGVGGGGELVDIVALTLRAGGELVHQRRHQRHHVADYLQHRRAGRDAAVEYAVEQVLDGPGQFADHQRPDHAPAALEGVEGAADLGQRFAVVDVGLPARQVFVDGFQDLAGLFDEDLAQLLVHRFLVGRRRQQAGRHLAGRRVDRLGRGGHHLGQGQRLRLLRLGLGLDRR